MKFKQSLLWPLTLPYGALTRLRARAYRWGVLSRRRLDGVVISVGNLTVGGTGKTPMVLLLAEHFAAEGKKAAILTRGYRGEVSANDMEVSASGESTSDEAQLLKARLGNRVAVGIGADRFARGLELSRGGAKWFILDDGFQHLSLARDVDIVLVDASNPFGGGHLLPAGLLREPHSALARANIIVITRSRHAPAVQAAIRRHSDAPIFHARTQLDSVRVWRDEYPGEEEPLVPERKYFAFCGIGNPSAFLADLREWGFRIVGRRFFPDHHRYSQQDVHRIEGEARKAGADAVICTEKDLFNLRGVRWDAYDVRYCRISVRVEREDEFWRMIAAKAESRSRSAW